MNYQKITICEHGELTAYLLDNPSELKIKSRPGILIYPGGGYQFCSEREAEPVAMAFAAAGFPVFVMKYTTGKGYEEAYKDGQAAMDYVYAKKEEFGLNHLLVCGFSAGAHLACAVSVFGKNKPDGMILVYPPLIGSEWEKLCPSAVDVLSKIDKNTPKAFIVHAYDDPIVPVHNAYRLMQKLDENGIEFEAHVFRSGGHGFSTSSMIVSQGSEEYRHDAKAVWVNMAVTWIKEGIGDIEFFPKEKVDVSSLPEILQIPLKELIQNPENKKALESINPVFAQKHLLKQIGDASFGEIMISAGASREDLVSMASLFRK